MIDKVAQQFIPFWPAPNRPGQTPNYINSQSDPINDNQLEGRVDLNLSDKWKIFARYTVPWQEEVTPGGIPLFNQIKHFHVQNGVLGSTYLFSPQTILDVRIGYHRESSDWTTTTVGTGKYTVEQYGIAGLGPLPPRDEGVPAVNVAGFTGVGSGGDMPLTRSENSEHFSAGLTHIRGRHTFKFGGELWPIQINNLTDPSQDRGTINFDNVLAGGSTGLPSFLLGQVHVASLSIGQARYDPRATFFSFYGGDDMRVTPRLTLTLGLRWEIRESLVDKENHVSTFIPGDGGRIAIAGDPQNGFSGRMNRSLYPTPLDDFGPRIGLSYALTGDRKTVLRGGYGIFYNVPIFNSYFLGAINPPFVVTETFIAQPSLGLFLPFSSPFPTGNQLAGGLPGGVSYTPWFKQGYVQKWSFGVQRQLTENLGLDVSYVGNKGTHLDGLRLLNQGAVAGTPNALYYAPDQSFGGFTAADSFGDSNYHSLEVKATRRMSQGLSFIVAYTYGHAIDNSEGEGLGSGGESLIQDNENVREDRANADFDVRHRLAFSTVYNLPLPKPNNWASHLTEGWQVAGIYQFSTGFPATIFQPGDRSGVSWGAERAEVVSGCSPNLPSSERTRLRWFNTDCFGISPLGQFGSSGRNTVTQPGFSNVDLSLIKKTPLSQDGTRGLEFRADFFNALNHTQFGGIGWAGPAGLDTTVGDPTFGAISSARDPRQIQLGLKLYF
jgi:hypothetical protein